MRNPIFKFTLPFSLFLFIFSYDFLNPNNNCQGIPSPPTISGDSPAFSVSSNRDHTFHIAAESFGRLYVVDKCFVKISDA
jgi:hypothetical protein